MKNYTHHGTEVSNHKFNPEDIGTEEEGNLSK